MITGDRPVRVLYSFPHKLGAGRICYTAWQQVSGLAAAGAELVVFPGSVARPVVANNVITRTTLAYAGVRIPYRLLGTIRACALHDTIVAHRLANLAGQIDVVHAWPLGALKTLKTAKALGIPAVLERPNTHTRYAYDVVQKECDRIGVVLPPGAEHAYQEQVLLREEAEYKLADRLLCPSKFVAKTFLDEGFHSDKLALHQYGYDPAVNYPAQQSPKRHRGLKALFVGLCAVRKGLHFALQAWLQSKASSSGEFAIAGAFIPGYAEKLSSMLSHPSVRVLGHRDDVPELMRNSDVLVLPTIEEGSALVAAEARGSGCVLLVSEAAGAVCRHMHDALVHRVGDVPTLTQHLNMLHADRELLERLRIASLNTVNEITWEAAGRKLLTIYREVIQAHTKQSLWQDSRTRELEVAAPAH